MNTEGLCLEVFKAQEQWCPKKQFFKESTQKWQIHMNWDISSQGVGQLGLGLESDVLLTTP